jgi:competence protein ComEA
MAETREKGGNRSRIGIFLILTCLAALGSLTWSWFFPGARPVVVQTSPDQSAATAADNSQNVTAAEMIPVYLVGAVTQPGIYQIERGSYLYQLIEQAGGLLDDAAAESINLAMRLDENQLIRIPTRAEVAADPAAAAGMGEPAGATKLIDLNRADTEQLDTLPGVGPSTAKAILEYRKKNGSFQNVEDLMKVPGIKESRFNAIKDFVLCKP